ncbi:hypothetical protein CEXT_711961 [Caerostris extrusa]|uniref:Uncharacterized protein n=1 Tax=Caerostris extrusa TaxID=172846 RepID=A0AAV4PLT1_CAEEX|nr:hypothetical protein CEXT_711961 [Caerostris extrusa]
MYIDCKHPERRNNKIRGWKKKAEKGPPCKEKDDHIWTEDVLKLPLIVNEDSITPFLVRLKKRESASELGEQGSPNVKIDFKMVITKSPEFEEVFVNESIVAIERSGKRKTREKKRQYEWKKQRLENMN